MAIPGNTPDKITYFAETDYRSKRIKFGIRDDDRARHMYVIGKTGMGKSTLLENLAIQDIQNGEGMCFIDPHGGTAETLLSYVPEHRMKDVIYFAPFDQEYPVGLNVMEDLGRDKRPLVTSGLIGAFKKVWVDAWSARMEYILSNALLALMEYPGATLLGVNRMFADKNYRNLVVANVTDPSVKAFWVDEFAKYSDKFATEATAAIQNKIGQFAANPLIRNMVGQPKSTFDIRKVMDERKIFIVNLSKGRMGEGNANLVGSMLITKMYLAAMSRAEVSPDEMRELPPFYLYVDEFQSFANESFADILSEARKYKLALTVAHQYIEQMSDEVRAAVFGNVGTMISFRVGSYDAEVLEKEFAPAFTSEDMVNLGFAQIYLKLMINGVGSAPFSATTLPRPKLPPHVFTNEVIAASRAQFARPRKEVEEEILKWHESIPDAPRDPNAPFVPETRKYPPGARPIRSTPSYGSNGGGGNGGGVGSSRPSPRSESSPREEGATQNYRQPSAVAYAPAPQPFYYGGMQIPTPPPSVATQGVMMAPTLPPPVVRPSPHQPFREELAKIGVETVKEVSAPVLAVPRKPQVVTDAPSVTATGEYRGPERRHHPASLSQVPPLPGVNTKPYVRPNEKVQTSVMPQVNLSVLKSQPKKDKGPSEANLSSLRAVLDAALAKEKVAKEVKTPTTISSQDEHSVQSLQKEEKKETVTLNESPKTAPTPPPTPPVSLLGDTKEATPLKEVPEEVLRSVLAD